MSQKRSGNISLSQKELMVEFIENNEKMKSGKFTNDFTFKTAQKLWEKLASILNAVPGARKDWRQWRKTWHDLRTKTKGKQSTIIRHRRDTGGGEPMKDELTPIEEKIIGIVGSIPVEGHQNTAESSVDIILNDKVNINLQNDGTILEQIEVEHDYTDLEINCKDELCKEIENSQKIITPVQNIKQPIWLRTDPVEMNSTVFEKNENTQKIITPKKIIKQPVRVKRLQETISATHKLAGQCEQKNKLKEDYYKKKLMLYEEDINVKRRIANALESITQNFL